MSLNSNRRSGDRRQIDRRNKERKNVFLDVQVRLLGGAGAWQATTINVSLGGCFFLVPVELTAGARAEVVFPEADDGEDLVVPFEVVHCVRRPVPVPRVRYGLGVRFADLEPGVHDRLERLIDMA